MKKVFLLMTAIFIAQLNPICSAQQMIKNGFSVDAPGYMDDEYININFDSKHLSYSFDYKDTLHLDFFIDPSFHNMTVKQYAKGTTQLQLLGSYKLNDNLQIDTLRLTYNYEPYNEHDTVLYKYESVKDGSWIYYYSGAKISKKEIYLNGKLTKTYQADSKGAIKEVK